MEIKAPENGVNSYIGDGHNFYTTLKNQAGALKIRSQPFFSDLATDEGLTDGNISEYLDIWIKLTLCSPSPRLLNRHGWKPFACSFGMSLKGFLPERFHVFWMFRKTRCPRTWRIFHVRDSSSLSGIADR